METKFQSAVKRMIERDGNIYTTARNILNLRILSVMHVELDDLPDVSEIADAIEAIAEAIEDDINQTDIKMILDDFTFEYIEQICL